MTDFKDTITCTKESLRIRVNISYANDRLSITGDIYENGRDVGGGQCYEELLRSFPESARLVEIWRRWHLNDLNAGDVVQEAYLRAVHSINGVKSSYESNCSDLESAGLLVHDGYKYGSQWKFEPVPDYILVELKEMIKEAK